jgi:hypothetical protein
VTRTPDEIQRIKEIGLECLGRVHRGQTWEDWMGVGAAMDIITEEALSAVNAPQWDKNNKRAITEFNRRWDDYEAGNHKPLTKQERYALREVMSNPEVSAYRNTLTEPEKRRLNHPNAVINKWKRQQKAKAIPAEDRKPSPQAQLKATNLELQEELHRLKKNGDGNLFSAADSVKDIAATFTRNPGFSVGKIKAIAREMLDWAKAQEKISGAATQARRG